MLPRFHLQQRQLHHVGMHWNLHETVLIAERDSLSLISATDMPTTLEAMPIVAIVCLIAVQLLDQQSFLDV